MTAPCFQGKPPAGAARGGDGEHGNERGAQRLRAGHSQCSRVGAGEVNNGGRKADLPTGMFA
ncbi:hypothetical protein [Xenorhabdus anantnagensis]|uniref:Uncharacterized protein n=1 Tax=Xenorhabdus anantnagensis TaxID=3025875 RepID=A0ABT5LV36_9GAMM|nr:hypothetical protein [Xenorhabdus anantnagensis]MDC9598286.1 hypothetical protein [Xenorhabdus anantnagensis]